MQRSICFLALTIILFLAACQRASGASTPTPLHGETSTQPVHTATLTATETPSVSPARTRRPTATKKIYPTWTPILATVTPLPTATPITLIEELPTKEANDYILKPWNGEEAWRLIRIERLATPLDATNRGYTWYDWSKIKWLLSREILSRFPDSPDYPKAASFLISPESYTGILDDESSLEPFRQAFEATLNAKPETEITTDTLTTIASGLLSTDYVWVNLFPANNVLSDGKPGWILGLHVSGPAGAAFAISGDPGRYRLVSPTANWRLFRWDEQSVSLSDLNANGIPEIDIHDSYWGTGMSHFCREIFSLYEWNDNQFVNLTPNLNTRANWESSKCLDFEFGRGPNGTQVITTGNSINSYCYDDNYGGRSGIGSLVIKRRYEWNGHYYVFAGEEVTSLENSIPNDWPLINKCSLSWANEAGPANDQAFQLLPTLIAQTDPALTAEFTNQFGPAYRDYFHFKLGAWYAMRGQQSEAIHLLTQVRDHPENTQFNTASQLADAFLGAYPSTGVYAGCVAANKLLDIYQFKGIEPGYLNTPNMQSTWGFSELQWAIGSGSFFSGASARLDPLNLCNMPAAFQLVTQKQRFAHTDALLHWLDSQQIPHTGLQEGDVDGDSRRDWLILLGTGTDQSWHLWALLNKNGGVQPLWVAEVNRSMANIPAIWNTFTPNPAEAPLNIYQWTDGMVIFRISSKNGWTGVDKVYEAIGKNGILGFTVLPAADGRPINNPEAEELKVVIVGEKSWQTDWYILGWDPAINTLRVVSSPKVDQDQQVKAAESLLFDQGDPQGALEILNHLLSRENKLVDSTGDTLPIVRPYLQYLLGLAYEMSGDETNAVLAYWTLWHDFPIHPLSYVVQQKLALK